MNQQITHRSFVSYIDRTRDYYIAQGYEKPYRWARFEHAPFAHLRRPLAKSRVSVVTTASSAVGQEPVSGVLRGAKQVWSGESATLPERLFTDDLAWDKETTHTNDVGSFLPLTALARHAEDCRIGALAPRYFGVPTDYSQRRTIEQDAPQVLAGMRSDAVDVALLVPL